jgi:hypothetical protein
MTAANVTTVDALDPIHRISSAYDPWPKQQLFHQSYARYRLFGGAQGPGKSTALLWEAILCCLIWPGSNALLLRRTCPELDSGLIAHMEQHIIGPHPWVIGGRKNFNRTDRIVRFPNGSTLKFGHCESFRDVFKYDGAEYVFIGFDELTQFPFRVWEHLRLRNRCPVPGSRPCMAGATNPGGENGEWVKALWIDRKPFPGMDASQYDPSDYEFVPATVLDNPIYANDFEYIKNLEQMNPGLRAQRMYGRWDKFEGQFFSNWDPDRAIWDSRLRSFGEKSGGAIQDIPKWWTRWMSMDWGFAHWSAVHWHAVGEIVLDGERRKIVFTYREQTYIEKTMDEIGADIAARSEGEKISAFFLSHDAFGRKESSHTLAMQIGSKIKPRGLPYPIREDRDRVGGWNLMYELLELDNWMIFDSCVETIKALPTLIRDPMNLEDVKKNPGSLADDIADGVRIGLKNFLRPRKKPQELIDEEALQKIQDPTAQAMARLDRYYKKQHTNDAVKPRVVPRWAVKN